MTQAEQLIKKFTDAGSRGSLATAEQAVDHVLQELAALKADAKKAGLNPADCHGRIAVVNLSLDYGVHIRCIPEERKKVIAEITSNHLLPVGYFLGMFDREPDRTYAAPISLKVFILAPQVIKIMQQMIADQKPEGWMN